MSPGLHPVDLLSISKATLNWLHIWASDFAGVLMTRMKTTYYQLVSIFFFPSLLPMSLPIIVTHLKMVNALLGQQFLAGPLLPRDIWHVLIFDYWGVSVSGIFGAVASDTTKYPASSTIALQRKKLCSLELNCCWIWEAPAKRLLLHLNAVMRPLCTSSPEPRHLQTSLGPSRTS